MAGMSIRLSILFEKIWPLWTVPFQMFLSNSIRKDALRRGLYQKTEFR